MVNLKNIGYGLVSLFIGTFLMMILLPLITQLMTAVNAGTYAIGDTAEGTIWIGVILTWLLTVVVLPSYFMYTGATEQDNIPGFAKIIMGALISFLGIIISTQTWFMITGISDAMTGIIGNTTIQAFYWIGIIITWGMLIIVIPWFLIMDGYKEIQTPT